MSLSCRNFLSSACSATFSMLPILYSKYFGLETRILVDGHHLVFCLYHSPHHFSWKHWVRFVLYEVLHYDPSWSHSGGHGNNFLGLLSDIYFPLVIVWMYHPHKKLCPYCPLKPHHIVQECCIDHFLSIIIISIKRDGVWKNVLCIIIIHIIVHVESELFVIFLLSSWSSFKKDLPLCIAGWWCFAPNMLTQSITSFVRFNVIMTLPSTSFPDF